MFYFSFSFLCAQVSVRHTLELGTYYLGIDSKWTAGGFCPKHRKGSFLPTGLLCTLSKKLGLLYMPCWQCIALSRCQRIKESVYKLQLQLCVLVSVVQRNRPMGKRYVCVYIYIIYLTLRDFKKSTTNTDKYVYV